MWLLNRYDYRDYTVYRYIVAKMIPEAIAATSVLALVWCQTNKLWDIPPVECLEGFCRWMKNTPKCIKSIVWGSWLEWIERNILYSWSTFLDKWIECSESLSSQAVGSAGSIWEFFSAGIIRGWRPKTQWSTSSLNACVERGDSSKKLLDTSKSENQSIRKFMADLHIFQKKITALFSVRSVFEIRWLSSLKQISQPRLSHNLMKIPPCLCFIANP